MKASRCATWLLVTAVVVGYLIVALAWSATVAPFRGSDEHDHTFRADAVGHGEILPQHGRRDGTRGDLLTVRRSIVDAARPVCEVLQYVSAEDCRGWPAEREEEALIPSGAARYNPSYYAVAGIAARPFDGVRALGAMRVATAVTAALLMGLAVWVASAGSRTSWPAAALVLSMTPAATFASGLATPNGVHLAATALVWASALRLRDVLARGEAPDRLPWVGLTVGAVVAVHTHSLGVLWLAGILLVCWLSTGRPAYVAARAVRTAPRLLVAGAVVLVIAGVGWAVAAGTNDPRVEARTFDGPIFPALLFQPVLWFLQSFATTTGNWVVASGWVYVVALATLAWLLVLAMPHVTGRERRALAVTAVLWLVVPVCLTLVALPQLGFAWQGRYSLPIGYGFVFLAAHALDRSDRHPRLPLVIATTLTALMTVAAQAYWHDDSRAADSWLSRLGPEHGGPFLVAGVACAGLALVAAAAHALGRGSRPGTDLPRVAWTPDVAQTGYVAQSFGRVPRLVPRRHPTDS